MVNSMNKKILAIVEGEKKEPQLLNRLFDTYSRCIQFNLRKINRILPEDGENFSDDLYDTLKKY